jgi:hypothetical protein
MAHKQSLRPFRCLQMWIDIVGLLAQYWDTLVSSFGYVVNGEGEKWEEEMVVQTAEGLWDTGFGWLDVACEAHGGTKITGRIRRGLTLSFLQSC